MKKDKIFLEDLQAGQEEVFIQIYRNYRDAFISWMAKLYSTDKASASDCFQDAVIILLNNVKSGKLKHLDSEIKTYLFSVGKNVWLKKFKQRKNEIALDELNIVDNWEDQDSTKDKEEGLEQKSLLIEKVAELTIKMKEPCKSILKHYYYENLSMDQIAEALNYKNANTVKSQKLRCMKYLEESLEKEMMQ
ncbi:MAG: sigma-70 family RNA polymerase sigma factor [Bacteroides sp.]|nr:sigma-70 family RNA polymerase sigma factor [Bacteroides sp.]